MRTVPLVEQPQQQQQQRILQMGQTIQKTVPRLVAPSHVSTVQSNPMPRIRANRPRLPAVTQPRMVTQTSVRQPRQVSPGNISGIRQAAVNQQNQRIVQNIRPQLNQYRPQGQQQQQQQQPRFSGPILQRISTVSTRMATPNTTTVAVPKKTIAAPQKLQLNQNNTKPQFITETKSSSTSTDINELDDLENSITAAKIHKTPPEPPPTVPTQTIGGTQYIAQPQPSNIQMCQKPNFQNQRPANQNPQTIQQPFLHNPTLEDSRKVVTLRSGESMPLTEYKRKIHDSQYVLPQQQQQPQPQQLQNVQNQSPIIRGNSPRGRGGMRGGQARGSYVKKQYRQPVHQQLQQQSQTDQSQHIIETEARESAKMLVVLQSGEQRLITFTLPKESCTVQELLEQVGVPFTDHTNIECVTNPGVSIDYLVTVGVTCSGTPSEIISAAENTLQLKQMQQQQQQQLQQQQVSEKVKIFK